jgi:hypothetical protein
MAAHFQIYESRKIALAAGDMIRVTQNGFTKDKRRLNSGNLKQVNGLALPRIGGQEPCNDYDYLIVFNNP